MTESELQTLYKTICIWLGFKPGALKNYWITKDGDGDSIHFKPNFLHDRNQQKWIREKLKEDEYTIDTIEYKNYSRVIISGHLKEFGKQNNGDLDLAFLMAVKELIENNG